MVMYSARVPSNQPSKRGNCATMPVLEVDAEAGGASRERGTTSIQWLVTSESGNIPAT